MKQKISIIVPVYNVEGYLEFCINSIVNQTYRNLQIILVDDGSTDESGKICDIYANKDDRIVVIHQQNKGLVAARKAGLNVADGDYIGFVDGDDYIEKNMYNELLTEIMKEDADFIHSGFYQNDKVIVDFIHEVIDLDKNREKMYIEILRMERIWPSIWSKLFKRNVIKKAYANVPDSASYGEDLICFCELIGSSKKIVLLNKSYYHYIVRSNSISNAKGNDKLEKEIELYLNVRNTISKYVEIKELEEELQGYLRTHMIVGIEKSVANNFWFQKFSMSNPEITRNKKVVLYGAGEVGKSFYSEISRYQDCRIVGWIDSNANSLSDRMCIHNVNRLKDLDYDIVIIAINKEITSNEIKKQLIEFGIEEEKIYWEKPLKNF